MRSPCISFSRMSAPGQSAAPLIRRLTMRGALCSHPSTSYMQNLLPICLSIYLLMNPASYLSTYQSIDLSTYYIFYIYIYIYIYVHVCMCTCPLYSENVSVYIYIYTHTDRFNICTDLFSYLFTGGHPRPLSPKPHTKL